jgi:hypothetical protein
MSRENASSISNRRGSCSHVQGALAGEPKSCGGRLVAVFQFPDFEFALSPYAGERLDMGDA